MIIMRKMFDMEECRKSADTSGAVNIRQRKNNKSKKMSSDECPYYKSGYIPVVKSGDTIKEEIYDDE